MVDLDTAKRRLVRAQSELAMRRRLTGEAERRGDHQGLDGWVQFAEILVCHRIDDVYAAMERDGNG